MPRCSTETLANGAKCNAAMKSSRPHTLSMPEVYASPGISQRREERKDMTGMTGGRTFRTRTIVRGQGERERERERQERNS